MTVQELIVAVHSTRADICQSYDGKSWVLTAPVVWSDGPRRVLAADPVGTTNEQAHESAVDLPNITAAVAAAGGRF